MESLDLNELGFERTIAASTGRPGLRPSDMLRLYIWGYLNQAILAFNILHAVNAFGAAAMTPR